MPGFNSLSTWAMMRARIASPAPARASELSSFEESNGSCSPSALVIKIFFTIQLYRVLATLVCGYAHFSSASFKSYDDSPAQTFFTSIKNKRLPRRNYVRFEKCYCYPFSGFIYNRLNRNLPIPSLDFRLKRKALHGINQVNCIYNGGFAFCISDIL